MAKVLTDLNEFITTELFSLPQYIKDDDAEFMDVQIEELAPINTLFSIPPQFGVTEDPFKELGPIQVFSARKTWTAPRSVR